MNIEEITRNPEIEPTLFNKLAELLFNDLPAGIEMFKTKDTAVGFVRAMDSVVESSTANDNKISQERFLQLGSAVGEAFIIIFGGKWKFSEQQMRWVVACSAKNGDIIDVNVFNKLRKRIENGEEDSISYFFDNNKAIIEGVMNF